jgi:hypothetical protein
VFDGFLHHVVAVLVPDATQHVVPEFVYKQNRGARCTRRDRGLHHPAPKRVQRQAHDVACEPRREKFPYCKKINVSLVWAISQWNVVNGKGPYRWVSVLFSKNFCAT